MSRSLRRTLVVAVGLLVASCTGGSEGNGGGAADTLQAGASEPSTTFLEPSVTSTVVVETTKTIPVAVRGPTTDDYEESACTVSVPFVTLECGYVTVPLDYSKPDAGTIRVATAFIDNGAGDRPPVVYLAGGPGASGVQEAGSFLGLPFDVIALDQRGIGASEPSLSCHEVDELPAADLFEVGDAYLAALQACRDRLVAEGVDLNAFASDRSARDIGVVHGALGFDEVDLFGVSYGARLALTKLRDDPLGVRSVILDSVAPIDEDPDVSLIVNAQRAFEMLSSQCALQPECAEQVGDLLALMEQLREDLGTDGDLVGLLTWQMLYESALIPLIPAVLAAADQGNREPLLGQEIFGAPNVGKLLSVTCREELPFAAEAAVENAHDSIVLAGLRSMVVTTAPCEVWAVDAAHPIEAEPLLVADVPPVLVFAGAFDPITPPGWSRRVSDRLGGTYVEIPNGGHAIALAFECTKEILESFHADPSATPDLGCVDELDPPTFIGFDG